jgi:branched-chain amino acid transport system ATP-binding protein
MSPLLELENVSKAFAAVRVADAVDLRVDTGEVVGVVGPNGAGKTSLMNLIAGTLPVDTGRIALDGVDVTRMPPHSRCRAGIARTHQIPQPFEGLTVLENVLVAILFGALDAPTDPYAKGVALLERADLWEKANQPAATLTLLERKRLELARALATGPRLLLLDEIGGGLVEAEIDLLVATIESLRGEGLTIVWIEHIVHALLSVVDRLVAMDFGRVLKDGPPTEVMASPEVQAVYMGVIDD